MPVINPNQVIVDNPRDPSREPLSPAARWGLLVLVVFFHVGGVWALTRIEPAKLIVGEIAPMQVRMVTAERFPQPEPVRQEAPPPEPIPPLPDLATMVEPPPSDLPPPVFPIPAPPPKPAKPRPPPSKPVLRPRTPAAAPVEAAPHPAAPAAPKTVSVTQVGYLVPPSPTYPASSRRSGEQGVATVRVLVDITGRPAQVSLQASSGHAALDDSALAAVRAAQFRPYAEGGIPQAVWVLVPVGFALQ